MSCRLHCSLQTTNFSSYGLQEEIVHINEDEAKIALSSAKHKFLITPSPSCLRTIQLLRSPSTLYFDFTTTSTTTFTRYSFILLLLRFALQIRTCYIIAQVNLLNWLNHQNIAHDLILKRFYRILFITLRLKAMTSVPQKRSKHPYPTTNI